MKNTKVLEVSIIGFIVLIIVLILPHLPGHFFDNLAWQIWSENILKRGLSNTYTSGTNYLPFYQYILWGYAELMGSVEAITKNIGYLRLVTLCFDMVGLYYVYKWVDKTTSLFLILAFNLLNITYIYNTLIWGQVDGILSTLVFLSAFFAYRQKMTLTSIYFILAVNMKLQAIIFAPLLGILFLINGINKKSIKEFLYPILAAVATQAILLLPFIYGEPRGVLSVLSVAKNSVGTFPRVSVYAFNFWYFICDGFKTKDTEIFIAGLTYKTSGLILFCVASFFAMLPFLKNLRASIKGDPSRATYIPREKAWIVFSLMPLLFFFFCTQMHERYSHPAFIFILAYGFFSRDFVPYIIFSLAYFLNLERASELLHLNNYKTLIFDVRFIAGLYALTIVYLCIKLFLLCRRSEAKPTELNKPKQDGQQIVKTNISYIEIN